MAHWYYSIKGKDYGPVSTAKIVDAVLRNYLDMDSYIISDKDKVWVKIKDVPSIMELIHKPADKPIFNDVAARDFAQSLNTNSVPEADSRPVFYNLPVKRLLLYLVLSFGFYEICWFIRQISYMLQNRKDRRGLFSMSIITWIFMPYFVFRAIELDKQLNSVAKANWNALILTLVWYSGFLVYIFRPFGIGAYLSGIISGLFDFICTVVILYTVQRYINHANRKLNRAEDQPAMWEYGSVIIGLVFGLYGLAQDVKDLFSLARFL